VKIIAVMSQKGGAGKTTLAVHLAVEAHRRKLSVEIIDTDPQQSAGVWSRARGGESPIVTHVQPTRLGPALDQRASAGVDLVIVDTAPHAGPDAVDVAKLANRVLIPVRPGVFDLAAARQTIEIVREAGVDSMLVLSACPHRAPEVPMAREALALSGLSVAETQIGDRRSFSRAIQTGRAVSEFEPDGKASEEIRALLDEVMK
jgi:chromosome partitioning protein